jgi:predicted transposase/invertase (TIGR01784 family)
LGEFLDVLIRANNTAFEEALKMGKTYPTMAEIAERTKEILKGTGVVEQLEEEAIERGMERGMERGIERGREQTARNFLKEGLPIETVARAAELPIEKVRAFAAEINVSQ